MGDSGNPFDFVRDFFDNTFEPLRKPGAQPKPPKVEQLPQLNEAEVSAEERARRRRLLSGRRAAQSAAGAQSGLGSTDTGRVGKQALGL